VKQNFCIVLIGIFLALPLTTLGQAPQKDMLEHKWKYIGVEEFSVVHPPDSTLKNDWLELKNDGTYEWIQAGKISSGTWKLNEATKIIMLSDAKTKKSLNYNLKNLTPNDLTIEYQTPDLVRTKYRYQTVKE
jgi:hypothetical protein